MEELRFVWNPQKASLNKRKHGVSFTEAQTVFLDDFARLISDPVHSQTEDRFILLGMSSVFRLLSISHCYRHGGTIRIISARKADKSERQQYESFRYA